MIRVWVVPFRVTVRVTVSMRVRDRNPLLRRTSSFAIQGNMSNGLANVISQAIVVDAPFHRDP